MRKWIIALGAVFLFLIFLPQIGSTPLGKPFFVRAFEKKSGTDVEIGSLKLSWFGPQIFRNVTFRKDSVTGSFEELSIVAPFWSFLGPFELKNGQIVYQGGKVENIEGQIKGNDFSLTGITMQGHLSFKGQIYSKLHFRIQIDIEKFPLVVVDQKLDQILGPTLDLFGTVSMDEGKGLIDLSVQSANLKTRVQGNLTPDGVTLAKPLEAAIRLTPEMGSFLLKDANPLFITSLSAENPVTLHIETDQFFFPLPYSSEKLKVGKATLDLGKMHSQNGQTLSKIINVLKEEKLSDVSQTEIWFTPVTFQISEGIFHAGRLDALLAGNIHICTWGKIDLIRDRLDMILGLPADTLEQSFEIKNLSKNYVLKIEVRGTTHFPDINKASAALKIATLVATGQISKKGILGGIAEFFSKKEEPDVPLPNCLFPWERP